SEQNFEVPHQMKMARIHNTFCSCNLYFQNTILINCMQEDEKLNQMSYLDENWHSTRAPSNSLIHWLHIGKPLDKETVDLICNKNIKVDLLFLTGSACI